MNKKKIIFLSKTPFILIVLSLFLMFFVYAEVSQDLIDKLREKYDIDDEESDLENGDGSSDTDSGDTYENEEDILSDLSDVTLDDGNLDVSKSTGSTVLSKEEIERSGIKKIISKNEIIDLGNAKIESISIKDGTTKITFAESETPNEVTFESNGKIYTVSAEKGTVEWIDGEMSFSEGIAIETPDGKAFTSLESGTKIKIGETIEIQGKASLEYKQDFMTEIKLIGKESSLILEKSEYEKTEFTNIDGEDITIITGDFHNSEECQGNCISYRVMGGWSKVKIDGNALVIKSVGDETRTVRFEDGKVSLYSGDDLKAFQKEYDFAQKTVINYNNGIPVIVKKTGEVETDKHELYDEQNPKVVVKNQGTPIPETQNPETQEVTEKQLTEFEDKAKTVIINGESLYDKVTEIYNKYEGGNIKKSLFISLIEKESKMETNVVPYYGSYGLAQATIDAVNDIKQWAGTYEFLYKYEDQNSEGMISKTKNDPEFNIQVGFDYLTLIEKRYGETHGFSYPKENYDYDGSKIDLYLIAYNAGPTKADRLMEAFKENGGGDWEDLKNFVNSEKGLEILGKDKVEIIPGYVDNIVSGAE